MANPVVVVRETKNRVVVAREGKKGDPGEHGDPGAPGPGLDPGGTPGQVVRKASTTDFDTEWHTLTPSDAGADPAGSAAAAQAAAAVDATTKANAAKDAAIAASDPVGSASAAQSAAAADATSKANAARDAAIATAATDATTKANTAEANAKASSAQRAANLSDLASASTARTNLGLGTAATKDTGTGASNVILGNDSRLTDTRDPKAHTHSPSDVTGTAVVTNDSRLSDARTPTAHAASHKTGGSDALTASDIGADAAGAAASAQAAAIAASAQRAANLSDIASASTARTNLGLGTAAVKDVAATGDATSSQVVTGDDSRLTNARTPSSTLSHASTHASNGSDPVTPASIGAAAADAAVPSGGEKYQVLTKASETDYSVGWELSAAETLFNPISQKVSTWNYTVAPMARGTLAMVAGREYAGVVWLQAGEVVVGAALGVTTAAAGSTIELGLRGMYFWEGVQFAPDTLIRSFGTVNGGSATNQALTAASPYTVTRTGYYMVCSLAVGGTPTVRSYVGLPTQARFTNLPITTALSATTPSPSVGMASSITSLTSLPTGEATHLDMTFGGSSQGVPIVALKMG